MRKEVSTTETSVGTLARGLDILGLFGRRAPELSQSEIAAALGLPLPTVHRLTAVLAERGFLERDPRTRRYRLGSELARLRLPELARPHVARLAAETGETANLAVLDGGEVVYLVSESGEHLLGARTPAGTRLRAHCTALGGCLLAQLPDELARAAAGDEPYERRTPATRTTWEELLRSLDRVRRSGVAESWEEYEIGLASVAVAVAGGDAAINVSLPSRRATRTVRSELARRLQDAAARIDAGLAAAGGD